jgi:uncharacterized membrane protein
MCVEVVTRATMVLEIKILTLQLVNAQHQQNERVLNVSHVSSVTRVQEIVTVGVTVSAIVFLTVEMTNHDH